MSVDLALRTAARVARSAAVAEAMAHASERRGWASHAARYRRHAAQLLAEARRLAASEPPTDADDPVVRRLRAYEVAVARLRALADPAAPAPAREAVVEALGTALRAAEAYAERLGQGQGSHLGDEARAASGRALSRLPEESRFERYLDRRSLARFAVPT